MGKFLCILMTLLASVQCLKVIRSNVPIGVTHPHRQTRLWSTIAIASATLKVKDLAKTTAFYKDTFGINVAESNGKTVLFLHDKSSMELLPADSEASLEMGEGFVGIGVTSASAKTVQEKAISNGGIMQVEVGEYFYGASMIPDEDEMKQFPITYGRIIDNNGFVIEVKENNNNCGKFMMNVIDLEESVAFYRDVLGMKLLRKRSNVNSKPKHGSLVACVGHESETEGTHLELVYNYATESLDLGNSFRQLTLTAEDLPVTKVLLELNNQKVNVEEDGALSLTDPNGYKIIIKAK